jgi:hypothetical protein
VIAGERPPWGIGRILLGAAATLLAIAAWDGLMSAGSHYGRFGGITLMGVLAIILVILARLACLGLASALGRRPVRLRNIFAASAAATGVVFFALYLAAFQIQVVPINQEFEAAAAIPPPPPGPNAPTTLEDTMSDGLSFFPASLADGLETAWPLLAALALLVASLVTVTSTHAHRTNAGWSSSMTPPKNP